MRFSVWPDDGRPWSHVRDIVLHCERAGWDGAYVADHFMPNDVEGRPAEGPMLECWSVVSALAALTSTVRLGTLVCGNLYRHPAVLANMAATVDHVSDGRFVLGLGAGWQVNEHAAYGIDLLDTRTRLDRFEEACAVVRSLLDEPRTTLQGQHYRITDAPCEPKPVQPRLPLLVGGRGERRTMRIAATYADEWNAWCTPDQFRHKSAVLDAHCSDVGRDPAQIRRSTQALVALSRDAASVAGMREQQGRRPVLVGTPEEVVEQVGAYVGAGVDELVVPDWGMGDLAATLDTLDLFWTEVAASFRPA